MWRHMKDAVLVLQALTAVQLLVWRHCCGMPFNQTVLLSCEPVFESPAVAVSIVSKESRREPTTGHLVILIVSV